MSATVPGLSGVDWSRAWLAPWRERGEALAARVVEVGLLEALNEAAGEAAGEGAHPRVGPVRFVPHDALPAAEPYEAFIARTAGVPTRSNLHDFFNALVWLGQPALKRRLNEMQAAELAIPRPPDTRGAVRDALTVFDENGAWLQAPTVLVDALRRRDWRALFVSNRALWRDARLTLVGHALMEKLTQPRKPITAHVWCVSVDAGDARHADGIEGSALASLVAARFRAKPLLPMPVLGVPGWWADNETPGFYDDATAFRAPQ